MGDTVSPVCRLHTFGVNQMRIEYIGKTSLCIERVQNFFFPHHYSLNNAVKPHCVVYYW